MTALPITRYAGFNRYVTWICPKARDPRCHRALIIGGILAYHALSNEFTGMAIYRHWVGRHSEREKVTREDSPSKFREATNLMWGLSGFCLIVSVASFWFYRKIDDDLDDYF